jgi:hypothetical protein
MYLLPNIPPDIILTFLFVTTIIIDPKMSITWTLHLRQLKHSETRLAIAQDMTKK